MKKYIKDLMIPVDKYPSVSEEDTLFQAVDTLEKSRGKLEGQEYQPRALLVTNAGGEVVGRLTLWDCLQALEPKYVNVDLDLLGAHGVNPDKIRKIAAEHSLLTDPLDTLCAKSAGMKVKKFMSPINEGNTIKAEREISDLINRLIVERRISLLVTEEEKVVGFVRVTEVFEFVAGRMRACAI